MKSKNSKIRKLTIRDAKKCLAVVDAGLCNGKGVPIPGKMCVEAAICYALGEPHGDEPTCVAPVVSLVQRNGTVRSRVMNCVTGGNLKKVLQDNINPSATIMTDEFLPYRKAAPEFAAHETVCHSKKEYARGNVSTNTVEGFFSLLKRGIVGTFHSVSKQHLPLYLSEFDHRYNTRKQTDGERMVSGLKMTEGKRLRYKEPTEKFIRK